MRNPREPLSPQRHPDAACARLSDALRRKSIEAIHAVLESSDLKAIPSPLGGEALILASEKNALATVNLLLRAGVDPNSTNAHGLGAAFLAAGNKNPNSLKVLLAAGAELNAEPPRGPIWAAVLHGRRQAVEILLKAGARLDGTDQTGRTLLHIAVEYGYPTICRLLLRAGLSLNARDLKGQSPLHYAARKNIQMLGLLLRPGVDTNARAEDGSTPALTVAGRGLTSDFHLLVQAGADPYARDNEGRTAFDRALRANRDLTALELLKEYPALAPSGDALDGAFLAAVRQDLPNVVKKLADMGADITQRPRGRTLLQFASNCSEDLKRILRSLKTEALIASAMQDHDDFPASTAAHSPTL